MLKNKNLLKFLLKIGFVCYLLLICYLLFVKVGTTDRSTYYINPDDHFIPFQGTINLIKLAQQYNFEGYYLGLLIKNVVGNLILLFPLGFFSPLVIRPFSTFLSIAMFAFFLSFLAELFQLIWSIGIFDVDDIIYNVTGATVGFLVLKKGGKRFFRKIYQ